MKIWNVSLFVMVYDNPTGDMVDEILLDGPNYIVCGHGGSFDWTVPTSSTGLEGRTLALWKYSLPEPLEGDDRHGGDTWYSHLRRPIPIGGDWVNEDLYSENRLPLYQQEGHLYIVVPNFGRTRAEAEQGEEDDKGWVEFGHRVEGDLYSLRQKTKLWDSDWDGYGLSKYGTSTSGYLEFMIE